MGCLQGKEGSARQQQNNVALFGKRFKNEPLSNIDEEELRSHGQQFVKISAIRVTFSAEFIESIQLAYEISSGSIVLGRIHCKVNNNDKKVKDKRVETEQKQPAENDNSKQPNQQNGIVEGGQGGTKNNNSINKQLNIGVFEIIEDDYLKELTCSINENLEFLSFRTYQGNNITYGQKSKKGRFHEVHLSKETFGPFTSNSAFNSFKIPIIPVPLKFLESMNRNNKITSK